MTAAHQTQNICIIFVRRRPNVFDVGPTLCKCYTNVLCLLGGDNAAVYSFILNPLTAGAAYIRVFIFY